MVDLTSAQSALREAYLVAVANVLNTKTNPLYGKIKQSSANIYGKKIVKAAPYGLNGGIGAGSETGSLPDAVGNTYKQFELTLKNLYGQIEISDKAIRASQATPGALVDILNAEMDGLLEASKFNLNRMLYGNGTGLLATASANSSNTITVDDVRFIMPGMILSAYISGTAYDCKVNAVNRAENKMNVTCAGTIANGTTFYVKGSKDAEITGIEAPFDTVNVTSLYGITRATGDWLTPYTNSNSGTAREISASLIQTGIDTIEENTGCNIDFISCGYDVRRAFQTYSSYYRRNLETAVVDGFKTISFDGIPMFADRFVDDGTMYLLDTSKFTLHQLCDWEWLEGENGRILNQVANKAAYSATLVKYADLLNECPSAAGKISDISSSVANPLTVTVESGT